MRRLLAAAASVPALYLADMARAEAQATVPAALLSVSPYWMWATLVAGVALLAAIVLLLRMRGRQRMLEQALDRTSDAAFILNAKGFVYVNEAACRSLGYSRNELLRMGTFDIDPDFTPEMVSAQIEILRGSERLIFETRHRRRDGSIFPVEIATTLFFHKHEMLAICMARDITARRQMEETLARREQEFRSLAESSPDFIVRYDRDGRISYINAALLNLLGLDEAEEPLGKRPGEGCPDGRFAELEQAAARAMESGNKEVIELVVPVGNAASCYHQIFVVPERDTAGQIVGVIAFGRDVTDIREAERRQKHFIDNLPGMAYTFRMSPDGKASFPFASPRIEQIFGLKPDEVRDDMSPLHALMHADDRTRIMAAVAVSAENLLPLQVESRVCRPGLPECRLELRSTPMRESDGSIVWHGIMLDITERKQAERELAESRAQLRGLVVQREMAREEERKFIAREIHDDLGQILTGLKMSISVIGQDWPTAAAPVSAYIKESMALTETAIGVVRNISAAIRPAELDMGIVAALRWQANRFDTFAGIPCEVRIGDEKIRLDETDAIAVFRIVQESLTNVVKHARASRVSIALAREGEDYLLEISDDGCGFDTGIRKRGSFGLVGMRERALMLGGELAIDSDEGGTRIAVRFAGQGREQNND
jgi:hypothetical protein